MKLKRSIKNPFNSIHAAALINFGECVSGMAFLTSLDQDVYRGIVTELGAKYYAKARGVITAECTVSGFKEGECKVEVDLIDEKKVRVATVYATWIVSKIKSKDT